MLNVQWQQLELELRPLLRHYVAHPISVNQSNAPILPIMLASKPLPEMEEGEAELTGELYESSGLGDLPQEQQLARLMVRMSRHSCDEVHEGFKMTSCEYWQAGVAPDTFHCSNRNGTGVK